MKIQSKAFVGAVVALSLLSFRMGNAATIIKLNLDDADKDVQFAGGVLSTIVDGNVGTTGDQNTDILFTDFLSFLPAITGGSYSLAGATAAGPAVSFGPVVTQNLTGGNFKIWDSANVLLLNVDLGNSAISGSTSTGAFFSVNTGLILSGSLAPQLTANSVSMSMNLTDITPFLSEVLGVLQPFEADASKSVAALPIPEPTTALLVMMSGIAAWTCGRRRS